jgi:serine O-acetyltransferase
MNASLDRLHLLRKQIVGKLWRLLLDSTSATQDDELALPHEQPANVIEKVAAALEEDLMHFAANDPASHGDPMVILDAYSSFFAVLHHRLAHAILTGQGHSDLRIRAARWIADQGKVISGVDIHPAARIGRRFVLDHAIGTVIGETCVIGDDCYILGGVVLGSRGISGNAKGKRHPTLGDGVQVGAYARILGPVTIGSHTFVASHSVVTTDIPPNSRVTIINQIQLEQRQQRSQRQKLRIFGACVVDESLMVMGHGFHTPSVDVLDEQHHSCPGITAETSLLNPHTLLIRLNRSHLLGALSHQCAHLQINDEGSEVVLIEPQGLRELAAGHRSTSNQHPMEPHHYVQDTYVV